MLLRAIPTQPGGALRRREIAYFGGRYSFLEQIGQGGTGSARVIYQSGIAAFDVLRSEAENELSYVSFELLRNGLILRLNGIGRSCCLGIRLSDVDCIDFRIERYRIGTASADDPLAKVRFQAKLRITDRTGVVVAFSVFAAQFESIVQYFRRKELRDKFYFEFVDDGADLL